MSIILRTLASKLMPHNNKRCVAPPGELPVHGGARPVVVASLMRSGTHVLIDTILNNFFEYRNKPLYLDLDQYIKGGYELSKLSSINAMVVKTHYPQDTLGEAANKEMLDLFKRSHILMSVRDSQQVFNSLSQFVAGEEKSQEEFMAEKERFADFWGSYDVLRLPFQDMIDVNKGRQCIERIANHIGQPCPGRMVLPIKKQKVYRVLGAKFLTRVLGANASIINTTVGFGRTKKPIGHQNDAQH